MATPSLEGNELKYLTECIQDGWISSAGSFIPRFEHQFSDFCGTTQGVAVANGTAALHLALQTLGIGPGMEVVVPALTFVSTANVVVYTGATPVFADVDPTTWTLDPTALSHAITERTRAVIPVHLYGHPCEMTPILQIAADHDLVVIEDAAEAHGARYRGKPVGGFGRVACFSFYGNKIITTGEGGMCVTNDEQLAETMCLYRDHGMTPGKRYWHDVVGFNYRMTNLQAAIGVAQLERVETILARKQRINEIYTQRLKDIDGVFFPPPISWAAPVCWIFTLLIDPDRFGMDRDTLIDRLKENNIDSRPIFYPIPSLPLYQDHHQYPVAESIAQQGVSLPSSCVLSDEMIEYICDTILICSGH